MAEIVENLVLEQLRGLSNQISEFQNQISEFQQETRGRLDRIELQLGLLEQGQATLLSLLASDHPARGEWRQGGRLCM